MAETKEVLHVMTEAGRVALAAGAFSGEPDVILALAIFAHVGGEMYEDDYLACFELMLDAYGGDAAEAAGALERGEVSLQPVD